MNNIRIMNQLEKDKQEAEMIPGEIVALEKRLEEENELIKKER